MIALERVWVEEGAWRAGQGSPSERAWQVFKFVTFTTDIKYFISSARHQSGDWKARPEETLEAQPSDRSRGVLEPA